MARPRSTWPGSTAGTAAGSATGATRRPGSAAGHRTARSSRSPPPVSRSVTSPGRTRCRRTPAHCRQRGGRRSWCAARHGWHGDRPRLGGAGLAAGTRLLPFGPVGDLAVEPRRRAADRQRVRDPATWKRYRGGTAGRLWLASQARTQANSAGRFTRILGGLAGQFASPMLVGGRLAFLSDHEGTGNVYSCALDGSDLRRHTDHDGFYARNASTDGQPDRLPLRGRHLAARLAGRRTEPRRLEISLGSPAARRAPRLISAEDHLGSLSCDHTGRPAPSRCAGRCTG